VRVESAYGWEGGRRAHVIWGGCGTQVGCTPILTAARFSQDDSVCLLLQHETDDDEMALEDFRLPDYVRCTPAASTRRLLLAAHATHAAPRASLSSPPVPPGPHAAGSQRAVGMWPRLCGGGQTVFQHGVRSQTPLRPMSPWTAAPTGERRKRGG